MGERFRHALPALARAAGRADTAICAADVCFMGEPGEALDRLEGEGGPPPAAHLVPSPRTEDVWVDPEGRQWATLRDGAVVIAAITSCTNTSNPSVLVGAGLIARNAVRRGLQVKPWVKTSLAPGSRVVTDYLERAGLLPYLDALGFQVVGYGCATCIGNSGPLPEPIQAGILEGQLVTAAVLSGNRNFEARIHPLVRANYLASPMLVVAYALAGTVDIDLDAEPVGTDESGQAVYLRDLWPAADEIASAIAQSVGPESFAGQYASVFAGDETWRQLAVPTGHLYAWNPASTYAADPPFFAGFGPEPAPVGDLRGGRVLGIFGDSVTTDHISPAGAIAVDGPAGRYLVEHGIAPADFNTYGSRRGNHEVMMRGTFANVRIRNLMLDGKEGGWTRHVPSGQVLSIFDAAMRYHAEGTPLVVFAGKEYGSGSSRDWAAKGPALLGVKVVVAESYERIHRSNLVGMGILPLQFESGVNAQTLGLTGDEEFAIIDMESSLAPGGRLQVQVRRADGTAFAFPAIVRLDASVDVTYYRHGGIMPRVLRLMLETNGGGDR
jgi:aconitate hydratase